MTCCFIGHRKIKDTPELRERMRSLLIFLTENGTVRFIFGDHSEFDRLCYKLVTELKEKHPEIKRIHFRKDYEDTDGYTLGFLISGYEESICPKGVGRAGRASYIERNQAMIRESDICIFYYHENAYPDRMKKSGTAVSYAQAVQMKKTVYNLFLPS